MLDYDGTSNVQEEVVKHEVQRGESIEWIAKKYGVSKESILSDNGLEEIFTGMVLDIRIPRMAQSDYYEPSFGVATNTSALAMSSSSSMSASTSKVINYSEKSLSDEAERFFNNRDYKKSLKVYSKLIKKYPKALYFFNRGICHYNIRKYGKAHKDITKALGMPGCTESMKRRGPELAEKARIKHEQIMAERGQMWGSVILGAAAVGLSTWGAIEASKTQATSSASYSGSSIGSYDSGSSDTRDHKEKSRDLLNKTYGSKCKACKGSGNCSNCGGDLVVERNGLTYACATCNKTGKCGACDGTGLTDWNRR